MADFKGDVMGLRLDMKARRLFVIQRVNPRDDQNQEWELHAGNEAFPYPTAAEIEDSVSPSRNRHTTITAAWSNLKRHNLEGFEELRAIVTDPSPH
jgi:hypothetical protein